MFNIKKLNPISTAVFDYLPKEQYFVSSHIEEGEVDAYLVRSAECHELALNERVLAFARAGAGVNNIPIEKCSEAGIVVFNTPGANANAVKELVLAGMLIASRNVLGGVEWAKTLIGKGDDVPKLVEKGKGQFTGPELMGKTLGVIGLGAIGVLVANAARAIGMDVIGYDPYMSVDHAWKLSRSVERAANFDELLKRSDYISIHVPLSDKTKKLISSPEFAKMKDGVIILNFARNGIIRNQSLFDGLESGKVACFVTDFPDEEVLSHDKVIGIPHLGASTPESEENCAMMAAMQLRDFCNKGSVKNSVNLPDCELGDVSAFRITALHKNLPNMVGQMTAILAKAGLNISEMSNKSKGEFAYTVFDLDTAANAGVIAEFASIGGIAKLRTFNG